VHYEKAAGHGSAANLTSKDEAGPIVANRQAAARLKPPLTAARQRFQPGAALYSRTFAFLPQARAFRAMALSRSRCLWAYSSISSSVTGSVL
jgi:hypothetical protein